MRGRSAGGFTLFEVLVAVFVLALCMVGWAASQGSAMRTRQQSGLMSRGVQLASTLADSMRANLALARGGDADNPYLKLSYDAARDGVPPSVGNPCYAGAACSEQQLAEFEIHEIKQALHSGFPGGRVVVCRDTDVWDAGRGALGWDCDGAPTAPIVIKLGWRGKQTNGAEALDRSGAFAPSLAIVLPGESE